MHVCVLGIVHACSVCDCVYMHVWCMFVCMCMCAFVYVHVYKRMYALVRLYVCACACMCACLYMPICVVCVCTCECVYMYECVYMCTRARVCVNVRACTCVCVCMVSVCVLQWRGTPCGRGTVEARATEPVSAASWVWEGARVSRPPAREQRRCSLIGCGLASQKLRNPAVIW